MNDTVQIFALALASNQQPEHNFDKAMHQIALLGDATFSQIYLIPCRDGVGADYWNSACLLRSHLPEKEIIQCLKTMEHESGRVRPSHHISLDIDLIAWGLDLADMVFNPKKLPLALDIKIPLYELWPSELLRTDVCYPKVLSSVESDLI